MKELIFSGAAITSLPAWVAECTSLESLSLSFTKIVEPPDLSTLVNLEGLYLNGCDQLRALPDVSANKKLGYIGKPKHLPEDLVTGKGLQGSHSAHCPLLLVPTAH